MSLSLRVHSCGLPASHVLCACLRRGSDTRAREGSMPVHDQLLTRATCVRTCLFSLAYHPTLVTPRLPVLLAGV